jgi:signal transduction histidine kinase
VIAVLREALSNIARHAQASRVEIQLNVDDERVRLSIADNGLGFDASAASIGNGVRNMGHRAEMLGGSCLVGVRIGGGTEVQWNVPV